MRLFGYEVVECFVSTESPVAAMLKKRDQLFISLARFKDEESRLSLTLHDFS
jgi:hypothetical protein